MRSMISQHSFEGYPEKPNLSNYLRTREFITQRVAEHEDIIALYEYGTVRAPGLSDLDFIAILRDKVRDADLSELIFLKEFPEYATNTLDGSILRTMSTNQFERICLLGDIQVKLIWGKPISFIPLANRAKFLVKLADIMDWIPERTLMLGVYLRQKHIPVKRVVGCLYSIRYSIKRILDVIGTIDNRTNSFVEKVGLLRENWFLTDRITNMTEVISLLQEGIQVNCKLINIVSNYLVNQNYYTPAMTYSDVYFYIDAKKGFRFTADDELRGIRMNSNGVLTLDVPCVWLKHLYCYSQVRGIVGDVIQNNILWEEVQNYGSVDLKLRDILTARIALANDMARFLLPLGLYSALYRFAHIKRL